MLALSTRRPASFILATMSLSASCGVGGGRVRGLVRGWLKEVACSVAGGDASLLKEVWKAAGRMTQHPMPFSASCVGRSW
jgi:hypothetical protein